MEQLALVTATTPPAIPGVDLRCCRNDELIAWCVEQLGGEFPGAGLVHFDPAWLYKNNSGRKGSKTAEEHYECETLGDIVRTIDAAYDIAGDDCYLLIWNTFPTAREWFEAEIDASRDGRFRWTFVSGGCWTKHHLEHDGSVNECAPGIGFHWRGDSEPIWLYRKGKPKPRGFVRNANVQPRTDNHSEKPVEWLTKLIAAFSDPGDTVVDLYAGLAPVADACLKTGRLYLGAELDEKRHGEALALIGSGVRR